MFFSCSYRFNVHLRHAPLFNAHDYAETVYLRFATRLTYVIGRALRMLHLCATLLRMITLHHLDASRSHRVLWLLEELGLEYELVRYRRDPLTHLAPSSLKAVHPLGKSPVLVDDDLVIAESAAILDYLVEAYATREADGSLALKPQGGSSSARECQFWLHFAEGSLMNWLTMKLVFMTIPTQPMPMLVRPIAKQLCGTVQKKLIDPNLRAALTYADQHLSRHLWFAGEQMTIADFQMSFVVEAALSRGSDAKHFPHMASYRDKLHARPAYQCAMEKGGPIVVDG